MILWCFAEIDGRIRSGAHFFIPNVTRYCQVSQLSSKVSYAKVVSQRIIYRTRLSTTYLSGTKGRYTYRNSYLLLLILSRALKVLGRKEGPS